MPLIPVPALSKTYQAHGNIPAANTSTINDIMSSIFWVGKQKLINGSVVGGTTSGARPGSTTWVVKGSSDGTTGAMDNVDRWTSQANVIFNTNGSAHSWIVLELNGWQVLIDCNTNGNGNIRIAGCRVADGTFTGGSATSGPTATFEFDARTFGGTGVSSNAAFLGDQTTLATDNINFCIADDGTWELFYIRQGSGYAGGYLAFVTTTGGSGSDNYKRFLVMDNTAGPRGSPGYGPMNSAGTCSCRSINNVNSTQGGWQLSGSFGNTAQPGNFGTDGGTGNYIGYSIDCYTDSGTPAYRGQLQDHYFVNMATVGGSYPDPASPPQSHVVLGDMLIPFPVVNLIT